MSRPLKLCVALIAAFAVALGAWFPAQAHHDTDPDPRIIGACSVRSGGGWLTTNCPIPGQRHPALYLGPVLEVSGPNREVTATVVATLIGTFPDGTVFFTNYIDQSAAVIAAELTPNGAWVLVPHPGEGWSQASLDKLTVLHEEERPAGVFIGGDNAISVPTRIDASRHLFCGEPAG